MSRALEGIAYWQARQGDFAKSLIIRQRLVELGRKWVTNNPGRKNRLSLLIDLNNLGNNFKNTERFEEAKATFQEALLAHEQLRADYPDDDEVQSQFMILCNNYAELLIETEEPQRVIEILARVRIAVSDHDLVALSIKRLDEAALIEYVQARALKAMEDWSASRLCYADVIRYRMAISDRSAADDYGSNDNLERLLGSVVMVGLTGINDGAIEASTQLVQTTLAKLDTGEAGNRWNPQRRIDLLKAYKMLGDLCQHQLSVLPAEAGESRALAGALAVKALRRAMGLAETIPDLPSFVMEDLRSEVDAIQLAVPSMAEF
jgi:tetratricopeptide (TPR) repeat protein